MWQAAPRRPAYRTARTKRATNEDSDQQRKSLGTIAGEGRRRPEGERCFQKEMQATNEIEVRNEVEARNETRVELRWRATYLIAPHSNNQTPTNQKKIGEGSRLKPNGEPHSQKEKMRSMGPGAGRTAHGG